MCFIAGPEELEALETDVVTPKETDFTKKTTANHIVCYAWSYYNNLTFVK